MRRLREQYPHELVVIGVHSAKFPAEKVAENIREAVIRHDITHPVVSDPELDIWSAYGVRGWPSLVIITPDGVVSERLSGEINADYFGARRIDPVLQFFEHKGLVDRTPIRIDLTAEVEAEPARPLSYPSKLRAASDGRLFIADTGHHRVLECRLSDDQHSAEVLRVFGSGQAGMLDGASHEASFNGPHGIDVNAEGTILYVADTENHAIRAIDLDSGSVRTVAGTGRKGDYVLRAPENPLELSLRSPWDVWAEGPYLFIAMAGSHQIWVLIDEEQIGPFAGDGREALVDGPRESASFNQPSGIVVAFGHILIADSEASAVRALDLTREGEMPVFTLVGKGLFEFGDVDGQGDKVRLQHATGIDAGHERVFIADTYNNKIKELDPTNGTVKTLAGTGKAGQADGKASKAGFYEPEGLSLLDRKLFIADTNNHLIRAFDLDEETVSTVTLTGLERLHGPMRDSHEQRVKSVALAPDDVTLTLSIDLPKGYKLNSEAGLTVRVGDDEPTTFEAAESFEVPLSIADDDDLVLDLSVIYCEAKDARLCLMHSGKLVIPIKVVENGETALSVAYAVTDS